MFKIFKICSSYFLSFFCNFANIFDFTRHAIWPKIFQFLVKSAFKDCMLPSIPAYAQT